MKAFFLALLLCLTPVRPIEKDTPKDPDLRGQTNWGLVVQEGRQLWIDGHPEWYAVGRIRADGKIELLWTLRETNRPAPAVYEVHADKITLGGTWGYEDEGVTVGKNGQLQGNRQWPDNIYRVKAED